MIFGKDRQIRLALACLLAQGHLLIEDIPGIGKTTLAQCLARSLGMDFQRVQFTSDLLPGDVIGASVYDQRDGSFHFHQGPLFTQVLLADEINRATPKTQSALLEAMEERQASVEGVSHLLPEPFFVVATQNPVEQAGVYPLPDSQLDRFLMRIHLGYPERQFEKMLLLLGGTRARIQTLPPVLEPQAIPGLQREVAAVHVSEILVEYVLDLLELTRRHPEVAVGLSPRAGQALVRAAQAWAWLDGRGHVLPEDVQAVLPWVVGHRLKSRATQREFAPETLDALLAQVAVA
ncbi:AAA family ATPase [Megalodesulfovibrio paquesii]